MKLGARRCSSAQSVTQRLLNGWSKTEKQYPSVRAWVLRGACDGDAHREKGLPAHVVDGEARPLAACVSRGRSSISKR